MTDSDYIAMLVQEPNLVVARVTQASAYGLDDMSIVLETRQVLKGEKPPVPLRAFFTEFANPGQHEIAALAGTSGIFSIGHLRRPFPGQRGHRKDQWLVYSNPYTRILAVSGPEDPLVDRVRRAILRTDLDSLTSEAEVICVGTWDRRKGEQDTLDVSEWITPRPSTDRLEIFIPLARRVETTGLYFLRRNEKGQLEPLGMGAGEFEVISRRIPQLGRSLDDVLRQVRARRFVAEAHRHHRDHP